MEKKLYDLMNWPDIEGIVYSDFVHPKQLLGQRVTKSGLLIQAYYPGAVKASVKTAAGELHEMTMADEEGYFAILLADKKEIDYTLVYEFADGNIYETMDAYNFPLQIPEDELKAFAAGNNSGMYKYLGANVTEIAGVKGTLFAVWAPNAMRVSVVGGFNNWDGRVHQMEMHDEYGVFELFIPGVQSGDMYKYEIRMKGGKIVLKADPYGYGMEIRPNTASIVYDIESFKWSDSKWMSARDKDYYKKQPMSIYELHLGSFRTPDDERQFYNYRELAPLVIEHVKKTGFTHVELMPVMEHPLDESWGYQVLNYFAPTARYGTPEDFKYFINELHKADIGVILDWVPAHFPKDDVGLALFDGTCLYEHMDKRKGEKPELGTLVFNVARPEVASFLMSSAVFWAKEYHADGIRMDSVASMLYLDYGKKSGEWVPNMYGGRENLEAVEFFKKMNSNFKKNCDNVMLIAEEATAWPKVTADIVEDGLGFDYKWNLGWMNDFTEFISYNPLFRKGIYDKLTFSMIYAYSEDFILVLPHDEMVHGKKSMFNKVPGDTKAEKLANLRASYGFMFTHPGRKLLFMGQEFAMENEWWEGRQLDWELAENEENRQLMNCIADLNALYKREPALYEQDFNPEGFEWINNISANECVLAYIRKASNGDELVVVVNFTPVERPSYKIGVPHMGKYKEIFNSNDVKYGGNGNVNKRVIASKKEECDGREDSIRLLLPSMGISILRYTEADTEPKKEPAEKKTTPKKTAKSKKAATVNEVEVPKKIEVPKEAEAPKEAEIPKEAEAPKEAVKEKKGKAPKKEAASKKTTTSKKTKTKKDAE